MPPSDRLLQGDDANARLDRRRRAATNGRLGILLSVLLWVLASLAEGHAPRAELTRNWPFVAATGLGIVSVLAIAWSRYFVRASREPFRYTLTVDPFLPIGAAEIGAIQWLHHDIAIHLTERIRRLRILEFFTDDEGAAEPETAGSHIHVTGNYGVRRDDEGALCVEVIPKVRIGGGSGPAAIGYPARVRLERGEPAVDAAAGRGVLLGSMSAGASGGDPDPAVAAMGSSVYAAVVESVYYAVASQIYVQIREDVEAKIETLPTRWLRAVAYLFEAEDYTRSNTLDAYDGGCELFERAMQNFDRTWRALPMSPWRASVSRLSCSFAERRRRLRRAAASLFPSLGRREILAARAELGYANAVQWRALLATMSGVRETPVFAARAPAKQALGRLMALSPDVPGRQRALFDAHVTAALTVGTLADVGGSKGHLEAAQRLRPASADADARYVFVMGLFEPRRTQSLRLLRRSVELDPQFVAAQHLLAREAEVLWRTRESFEPSVASSVCEEYEQALALTPGATAAWARLGYVNWLLAGSGDPAVAAKYQQDARAAFAQGREYRTVQRDSEVAALDHGLTRIAAERGEFPEAYLHYTATVSAHVAARSTSDEEHYYKNVGRAMLCRYDGYLDTVRRRVEEAETGDEPADGDRRLRSSVLAFVLNDHGVAHYLSAFRSGEVAALERACDSLQEATKLSPAYPEPHYNLGRALLQRARMAPDVDPEKQLKKAERALREALRLEPQWALARLRLVEVLMLRAQALADRYRDDEALAGEPAVHQTHVPSADWEKLTPPDVGSLPSAQPAAGEAKTYLQALEDAARQAGEILPQRALRLEPDGAICHEHGVVRARRRRQRRSVLKELRRIGATYTLVDGAPVSDPVASPILALLHDPATDWIAEFDELHVEVLASWAELMQIRDGPDDLEIAERLMEHIARHYYPSAYPVLGARRVALETLIRRHREIPGVDARRRPMRRQAPTPVPIGRWESRLDESQAAFRTLLDYALAADPASDSLLRLTLDPILFDGRRRSEIFNDAVRAPAISSSTLLWMGKQMQDSDGDLALAERALERASKSSDDPAAEAALRLAALLAARGKLTRAEAAYMRAVQAGGPETSAEASLRLAELLEKEGQVERAMEHYERAAESQGKPGGTRGKRASESEDPAGTAALRLADLLLQADGPETGTRAERRARARKLLDAARKSELPELRARATVSLARLQREDGMGNDAEAVLESALEDEPRFVLALATECASLDPDRSAQAFELVAEGADEKAAAQAELELGTILVAKGNELAATQWLERALERADVEIVARASVALAPLLPHDRQGQAERLLQYAAGAANPAIAAEAQLLLGALYAQAGKASAAVSAYGEAIMSPAFAVAARAAERNAELVIAAQDQDAPEARELVEMTLSYGALAAICLGDLADGRGLRPLAREAFERGAGQDHLYAPDAKLRLGWLLRREGLPGEAEQQLRAAAESGDVYVAPTALNVLAQMLSESGRDREAEECYRRVLEGPDLVQRGVAGARLGDLLAARKSFTAAQAAYSRSLEQDMPSAVDAAMGLRKLGERSKQHLQGTRERLEAFAEGGPYAAFRYGVALVEAGAEGDAEYIFRLVADAEGPGSSDAASELSRLVAKREPVEPTESYDDFAQATPGADRSDRQTPAAG